MHALERLQSATSGSAGILLRLQVQFEIGDSTSIAAVCTTRSRRHGVPKGGMAPPASSGSAPVAQRTAGSCALAALARVPRPPLRAALLDILDCLAVRPRHSGAPPATPLPARPAARLCHPAPRAGRPGLPSLKHATRSGVSEPYPKLIGSRQSPRSLPPSLRSSRIEAPSLRRRYPASPAQRVSPPPCRPKLPLVCWKRAGERDGRDSLGPSPPCAAGGASHPSGR